MTLASRLRSVRAILTAGVVLRAIAWGVAAALTLVVSAAVVDMLVPLSLGVRTSILIVAALTVIAVAAALWWRDRRVLSLDRVALWVEERFPSLEYTVVTAVETGNDSFASPAGADAWNPTARQRAVRALGVPVAVLAASLAVVLLLPGGAVARMRSPRPGDILDRAAVNRPGGRVNRLSPIVADVVPPSYSGVERTTVDEPTDLRALQGSEVVLRGRGNGDGIVARIGTDSLAAVTTGDRWSVSLRVAERPSAIRVTDGTNERIIALEPIIDNPPAVVLVSPARDSVFRAPSGRLPLTADISDDFKITSTAFEFIVSSGEGESFTFKSGTLGAAKPNAKTASISATLSLDSLELKAGDIVHVRAVARDANDVSGPGVGVSETRAIRIARRDEYDSVAVEAAAPSEAEKGAISQRMLIMMTEALQQKRPTITRGTLINESRAIAADQKKLRRTVGDVVYTRLGGDPSSEEGHDDSHDHGKTMEDLLARAESATNQATDLLHLEGDESPVVAVNKPLLEAYNAMWDASAHLELGELREALPYMRRALAAIQKARSAERLYLRGAPPRVVIDVAKARLKGKDKGSSSIRRATPAADSLADELAERFTRIVELSARDPRAASDSLLVLRIDALTPAPTFAAALSDAAKALRAGDRDNTTKALARARRALGGAPAARDTLARWGIVP